MNKQILERIRIDQLQTLLTNTNTHIPRHISLNTALHEKEITIITGVRRCGKSSLLSELIKSLPNPEGIIYLNLDDPRLIDFVPENFDTLYELWLEDLAPKKTKLAIFDEVQNVPQWERWMNYLTEQRKFKVFVTGSNSKLLSSEFATHLTGRHSTITLYPLSFREIATFKFPSIMMRADHRKILKQEDYASLKKLFLNYLRYGGFPRPWVTQNLDLLREYYSDILYRDIVRRHKLRQPQFIERFGVTVMSDVARPINKTKLTQALGIKENNTLNQYFSFFVECYLGFEVKKFDSSVRRQLRSASKFYAIDPALAYQVGIAQESKDTFHFENMVLIELLRHGSKVYYWQSNEAEIDFVVETQERERHLIQVAWSLEDLKTLARELHAFDAFKKAFPKLKIHRKLIITVEPFLQSQLSNQIETIPFVLWASG